MKYTNVRTGRTIQPQFIPTLRPFVVKGETVPHCFVSPKGAIYTNAKVPSIARLERYSDDCICPTPCGCRVEPDGTCEHGIPSWMMVVGVI